MSTTTITEQLQAKGNAARRQALDILAKAKPSAAELDRLPGLLADAGLAIADAERASGLLAEQEYLQGTIDKADPERSSAVADELREHEAETLRLIAERREQQRELDQQLATLGHQHRKAEQAKGRLVEVREELRKLAGEPEPDITEAYIVCPGNGASSRTCPPSLQARPTAPRVDLTATTYHRELERRRRALQAFDAMTLKDRKAAHTEADERWIQRYNEDAFARQQCYEQADKLRDKGKPHAAAKERAEAQRMFDRIGPRPQFPAVTYADAIEAGQHRTESEATYAA